MAPRPPPRPPTNVDTSQAPQQVEEDSDALQTQVDAARAEMEYLKNGKCSDPHFVRYLAALGKKAKE